MRAMQGLCPLATAAIAVTLRCDETPLRKTRVARRPVGSPRVRLMIALILAAGHDDAIAKATIQHSAGAGTNLRFATNWIVNTLRRPND